VCLVLISVHIRYIFFFGNIEEHAESGKTTQC
jgi:hypothetical protein